MATVVNDRDVLIMAASPRYTPPTDRGMFLTPPAAVFKLSANGLTASPSSFQFVATLLNMTGNVTWSTTGGISLVTNGNTATLNFASFTAVSGTITASITVDGQQFTATSTVTKVADGATGQNGVRGTINISAATGGVIWSDSDANAAIAAAGYGTHQTRDVVTLYNQAGKFSKTKFWDGSAWQDVAQVLDGSLLVTGSVNAGALAAQSVRASNLVVGSTGSALNSDPNFIDFPGSWTPGGAYFLGAGAGGAAPAPTYFGASNGANAITMCNERIPIDSTKTYLLAGSVFADSTSNRQCVFLVDFYDGNGAHIASNGWGDATYSGYANFFTPTPGDWRPYRNGTFGANAGRKTIPVTAKTCRIGVSINTGSGNSSTLMGVTALRLEEVIDGYSVQDGSIVAKHLKVDSVDAMTVRFGLMRTATSGARTEIGDNIIKMFADNNQKILHLGDSTK